MRARAAVHGFSAFELVVVMAVISVLALLAVPAISVANRKARLNEAVSAVQRLHRQAMVASRQYLMTYGTPPSSIKVVVANDSVATTAALQINGIPVETYQAAPSVYASTTGTVTYAIGTASYPGTGETTGASTWQVLRFASLDNQLASSITIYRYGSVYVDPRN